MSLYTKIQIHIGISKIALMLKAVSPLNLSEIREEKNKSEKYLSSCWQILLTRKTNLEKNFKPSD